MNGASFLANRDIHRYIVVPAGELRDALIWTYPHKGALIDGTFLDSHAAMHLRDEDPSCPRQERHASCLSRGIYPNCSHKGTFPVPAIDGEYCPRFLKPTPSASLIPKSGIPRQSSSSRQAVSGGESFKDWRAVDELPECGGHTRGYRCTGRRLALTSLIGESLDPFSRGGPICSVGQHNSYYDAGCLWLSICLLDTSPVAATMALNHRPREHENRLSICLGVNGGTCFSFHV